MVKKSREFFKRHDCEPITKEPHRSIFVVKGFVKNIFDSSLTILSENKFFVINFEQNGG